MEPLTFVTPSYADDFERFAFQRESMTRCGIDVPHVVVVHHEDVDLFRTTPHRDRLTVLSSRDVLPLEIESLRQAKYVSGWHAQQLTKLAAADVVDTDYVCVDSDTFWIRPASAEDFRPSSAELLLFEQPWLSTEIVQWLAHSLDAWGVDRGEHIEPVSWVYPVVPLARSLVQELRADLEARHGISWYRVLLEFGAVEYTIYGVYARYVRRLDGVTASEPHIAINYWKPQFDDFDALPQTVATNRDAKAVMVHSGLGVACDALRKTVEPIWRAVH